jgi:hypothetical protein
MLRQLSVISKISDGRYFSLLFEMCNSRSLVSLAIDDGRAVSLLPPEGGTHQDEILACGEDTYEG